MPRISKWFQQLSDELEMRKVEGDVHRITAFRGDDMTNALSFTIGKKTCKLLYRRYASLIFSVGVDMEDNDLALLESIHLLVEILDAYFKNVSELDIIFNFHKMLAVVDEFYLAGELQETSKDIILNRIRENEKLD